MYGAVDREIEILFKKDSQEKKRTGRGAFNKKATGMKGNKVGKLNTPSAYLTPAKIKKLSGECKTMNMNELMSYEELTSKPKDVQRTILDYWRSNKTKFTQKQIRDALGLKNSKYYDFIKDLGVEMITLECKKYKEKTRVGKGELDKFLEYGNKMEYEQFITLHREEQGYLTIKWTELYGLGCGEKALSGATGNKALQYIHNVRYRLKKSMGEDWANQILNIFGEGEPIVEEAVIEDIEAEETAIIDDIEPEREVAITAEEYTEMEIRTVEVDNIHNSSDIFDNKDEDLSDMDVASIVKVDEVIEAKIEKTQAVSVLDIKGTFTKNILMMILEQLEDDKQYNLELKVEEK